MVRSAVSILMLGTLVLAGCDATPASIPAAGPAPGLSTVAAVALPADFSLDLLVRAGPRGGPTSPAHLRPGHYVLFADGSFHHGPDPGLPPRTRHLSREQVAALYERLQAWRLADPAAANPAVNLDLIPRPPDGVLQFVLTCTGNEQRWMFERATPLADADAEPAAALARHLAALAWAPDRPRPKPALIPKRYDLGPDPYQPYRR